MPNLELAVRQVAWRLRQGKTEPETRAEIGLIYAAAGAAFIDEVMRVGTAQFTAGSRWKSSDSGTTLRDILPPADRVTQNPEGHLIIRIDRAGRDPDFAEVVIPLLPDQSYGDFVVAADFAATEFSVTGRAEGAVSFWTDFYVAW